MQEKGVIGEVRSRKKTMSLLVLPAFWLWHMSILLPCMPGAYPRRAWVWVWGLRGSLAVYPEHATSRRSRKALDCASSRSTASAGRALLLPRAMLSGPRVGFHCSITADPRLPGAPRCAEANEFSATPSHHPAAPRQHDAHASPSHLPPRGRYDVSGPLYTPRQASLCSGQSQCSKYGRIASDRTLPGRRCVQSEK
ncbi:hypothetical protein QBC36DRAFT_375302 [Triangularia setosa]|uniref:Uncharacterized protein n=1 Tax=Triangularia setosa TaxID=2587417 RepID=A0AAN7AC13_9PEZI|nr:hypothetical protein QBC36DRAFT_375302 [Podospora setosa]